MISPDTAHMSEDEMELEYTKRSPPAKGGDLFYTDVSGCYATRGPYGG